MMKENSMINDLEHLCAAEMNVNDAKKKIEEFFQQIDDSDDSSDASTSEEI